MVPVFASLGTLTYPLVLAASVVGAVFDPVGERLDQPKERCAETAPGSA